MSAFLLVLNSSVFRLKKKQLHSYTHSRLRVGMTTAATRTVFCSPLMMMKTRQFNKSRGKITLAVVVYVKEETKKKKKKRKVGVKSSSREVDKSDDCFVVRRDVGSYSVKKET